MFFAIRKSSKQAFLASEKKKCGRPFRRFLQLSVPSAVCFAVPKGSPMGTTNRAEIVLWNAATGRSRCISANWPANAAGCFLGLP